MNKSFKTDIAVLGGGPSGYSAAFRCSDLGLSTILIESKNNLGGVCLHVGCIPSKALLHIAKTIKDAKTLSKCGVNYDNIHIDINKIRIWKNNLIRKLSKGLDHLSYKKNIKILNGTGRLVGPNQLLIIKNDDEKINVFFNKLIIATGSIPINIKNISFDDNRIWTSSQALDLPNIPKRLLIIGSGIIGLEMATIYSAFGSKVDVVDLSSKILSSVDSDIIESFINVISVNFNILLNTKVSNIDPKDDGLWVTLQTEDCSDKLVCYENILVAIGRKTNLKGLNLEKIGIKVNCSKYIEVDNQLRTNLSNIYAIGDTIGNPMLAHKGIYQGKIVADILSGKKVFFDPLVIPSIVYTDPELGWVGITEKEAIKNNIKYKISIFPWSISGRAIASNSPFGYTKLIFDKVSNRIIGGIVLGTNAGELLGEISLAIEMGCYAEDIYLTMHAHPTLYETIGLSSEMAQGISIDF